MLSDIKLKVLTFLFVFSLLGMVWYQYKLNAELRSDLDQAKQELKSINDKILLSNSLQSTFNDKINNLEITQYNQQQELRKKLSTIKTKPVEEQRVEISNTYIEILTCIEKTSLGELCEK